MIDAQRQDQVALLAEVTAAGGTVHGPNRIRCPFHDDQHPSAGVYEGGDKAWRFKCHGCGFNGDLYDVRAKWTNRPVEEILREKSGRPSRKPKRIYPSLEALAESAPGKVEAQYLYTDPDTGRIDLIVLRWLGQDGKKQFLQASKNGSGYYLGAEKGPKPLYNRTRVRQSQEVVVVEGEKCVHVLHAIGIVATTSPGGAKAPDKADWSPLAGKRVYLWPDNDENGLAYTRTIGKLLERLEPAPEVYRIEPGMLELGDKEDVVDYLATLDLQDKAGQSAAVRAVLQDAIPAGPASRLSQRIEAIASGKMREISWPWRLVTELTHALLPGTVTVICGDPGNGKTFWLYQCAFYWQSLGHKIAVYEMEDDKEYHLHRALAQLEGRSYLTDYDWIKAHADEARESNRRQRPFMDALARSMYECPERQLALPELAVWVEQRAKEGVELICIDPITAAAGSAKPWIDDLQFLMRAKTAIREHGSRLVLVTHPRKGRKGAVGMEELAGGFAYARFTHCVLWIEKHVPPKTSRARTRSGLLPDEVQHSRTVNICKARNGTGSGLQLVYEFVPGNLRFEEYGILTKS